MDGKVLKNSRPLAKDGLGPFTSHNLFLKLLIEGGTALLAVYLVLIATAFVALWRRRQDHHAQLGIALLVGVHAAGMFGPILDAYPGNLLVWLIVGAGLARPLRAAPQVTS